VVVHRVENGLVTTEAAGTAQEAPAPTWSRAWLICQKCLVYTS